MLNGPSIALVFTPCTNRDRKLLLLFEQIAVFAASDL